MHGNVFYLSHDNTVEWRLREGSTPLPDHTAITRLQLVLVNDTASITIDSQVETLFINLSLDRITMKPIELGNAIKTQLGSKNYTGSLIVFDASHPNGLIWIDGRKIRTQQ